ncbi:hypothetical protein AVEN_219582-1 [Araneus ventricosus]|uniref:Uncharacterized protein n=1 Tax=Araneus ventricosus TaxID=182803 RepID=A0A4Y2IVB0_ARAVE|nr:hypothetical protein AVEN_219582-1 [Araneus ventricosus]
MVNFRESVIHFTWIIVLCIIYCAEDVTAKGLILGTLEGVGSILDGVVGKFSNIIICICKPIIVVPEPG